MECLICKQDYETEKSLHLHVSKKHKTKIDEYYRMFFPRKDLLTGDYIEFKNKDFYLSSLFNNRANMLEYLNKNPFNRIAAITDMLKLRKDYKNLKFAPSTIEARTSILPSPVLAQKFGIDYNKVCESLGMVSRYDYFNALKFKNEDNFDILIDTREQTPLKFRCPSTVTKLDFGDYTSRSHYNSVFIERKSLNDLIGTFSQGYERVLKEFERAVEFSSKIVVCVENPLSYLLSFKNNPKMKNVKTSPEFIAHRIREVCQTYPNVQFLFVSGREDMVQVIKQILIMENDVAKTDLQFAYDTNQFSYRPKTV